MTYIHSHNYVSCHTPFHHNKCSVLSIISIDSELSLHESNIYLVEYTTEMARSSTNSTTQLQR